MRQAGPLDRERAEGRQAGHVFPAPGKTMQRVMDAMTTARTMLAGLPHEEGGAPLLPPAPSASRVNMIRLLPDAGRGLQNPQRLLRLSKNPRLQLTGVQGRKYQVPPSLFLLIPPPLRRVLKMKCRQSRRLLLKLGSPLRNMIRLLPVAGGSLQSPQRLPGLPKNPSMQLSRVQERKHQVPHRRLLVSPPRRVLEMKGRQPKKAPAKPEKPASVTSTSASKTPETTSKTTGTKAAETGKTKGKGKGKEPAQKNKEQEAAKAQEQDIWAQQAPVNAKKK